MGNSAPEPKPSALHGSIETKKDISYYYAHAPRDQAGEAPAPMPVHRPIATTSYVPGEKVKEIKSFQFLDDGKFVKVYLPLSDLDRITAANVTAEFQTRSLCVTICDLEQLPLQFKIIRLQNDISPDECLVKILKTKVMLKLKKAAIVEKVNDEADSPNAAEAAAPDLVKEPAEGAEQQSVQHGVDNTAAEQEADMAQPVESDAKKHYPHWHQLRE